TTTPRDGDADAIVRHRQETDMTTVNRQSSSKEPTSRSGAELAESRARRSTSSELLLARYHRKPTVALRNLLIERHRKDVEQVAHALAQRLPRSVDVDDLVHAGIWGLMQAIEKFRAERG